MLFRSEAPTAALAAAAPVGPLEAVEAEEAAAPPEPAAARPEATAAALVAPARADLGSGGNLPAAVPPEPSPAAGLPDGEQGHPPAEQQQPGHADLPAQAIDPGPRDPAGSSPVDDTKGVAPAAASHQACAGQEDLEQHPGVEMQTSGQTSEELPGEDSEQLPGVTTPERQAEPLGGAAMALVESSDDSLVTAGMAPGTPTAAAASCAPSSSGAASMPSDPAQEESPAMVAARVAAAAVVTALSGCRDATEVGAGGATAAPAVTTAARAGAEISPAEVYIPASTPPVALPTPAEVDVSPSNPPVAAAVLGVVTDVAGPGTLGRAGDALAGQAAAVAVAGAVEADEFADLLSMLGAGS